MRNVFLLCGLTAILAGGGALVARVASGTAMIAAPVPDGSWSFDVPGTSKDGLAKPAYVELDVEFRKPDGSRGKFSQGHTFATGTLPADIAFLFANLLPGNFGGASIQFCYEDDSTQLDVFGSDLLGVSAKVEEPDTPGDSSQRVKVTFGGSVPHTKGSTFIEFDATPGQLRRGARLLIVASGLGPTPPPPADPADLAVGQLIFTRTLETTIPESADRAGALSALAAAMHANGWNAQLQISGRLRLLSIPTAQPHAPSGVKPSAVWINTGGDSDYRWELVFVDD